MSKQGVMRLVVTEGEIETKITFSTWNTTESGTETYHSDNTKDKTKLKSSRRWGFRYIQVKKNAKRNKSSNYSKYS